MILTLIKKHSRIIGERWMSRTWRPTKASIACSACVIAPKVAASQRSKRRSQLQALAVTSRVRGSALIRRLRRDRPV